VKGTITFAILSKNISLSSSEQLANARESGFRIDVPDGRIMELIRNELIKLSK
jgi:hypothetical protein